MKWMMILLAMGGPANPQQMATTSIGPYDEQDGCRAVAKIVIADGWKAYCYPVGNIPIKKNKSTEKPETEKRKTEEPKP